VAVPAWWKAIETTFRVAGQALKFLRKIPVVDDAIGHLQRALSNPVVVKLVREADDPDLDAALRLYEKRIPDDQRFEPADIVRWIREDQVTRRSKADAPTDWFMIAKMRRRVCGFILFHYYPSTQLALFAYMVVAKTPGVPFDAVSGTLSSSVADLLKKRKELRGYKGFVLEVEDPRKETNKTKQTECLARVRRFCTLAEMQGFSLRAFDIDYKQPRLSIDDLNSLERPMLLLSARNRSGVTRADVQLEEVKEVLSFVYTKVYPEGYSSEPDENRAYSRYCTELLEKEIAGLPGLVRSLSSAQLVALTRNSIRGVGSEPRTLKSGHP
jgi:hypothetical protein